MDEKAEFVGGDMDGRTMLVNDPAPQVIRVPRMAGKLELATTRTGRISARQSKPPFHYYDEYERVGRNDLGHVRYMKRA